MAGGPPADPAGRLHPERPRRAGPAANPPLPRRAPAPRRRRGPAGAQRLARRPKRTGPLRPVPPDLRRPVLRADAQLGRHPRRPGELRAGPDPRHHQRRPHLPAGPEQAPEPTPEQAPAQAPEQAPAQAPEQAPAQTDVKAGYFGPRFAAHRPDADPVATIKDAWGDWLTLADGDGLSDTDPAAIVVRHELPDGRVYGTTSVSLVALGAHALRYDFQPVPADPTTWYPVDLEAR